MHLSSTPAQGYRATNLFSSGSKIIRLTKCAINIGTEYYYISSPSLSVSSSLSHLCCLSNAETSVYLTTAELVCYWTLIITLSVSVFVHISKLYISLILTNFPCISSHHKLPHFHTLSMFLIKFTHSPLIFQNLQDVPCDFPTTDITFSRIFAKLNSKHVFRQFLKPTIFHILLLILQLPVFPFAKLYRV